MQYPLQLTLAQSLDGVHFEDVFDIFILIYVHICIGALGVEIAS